MTSEIKDILENMTTAAPEMEDYIGEDGLLYCGKCHTPKEAYFPEGKELFGRDRHPAECDCQRAAREQRQAAEEAPITRGLPASCASTMAGSSSKTMCPLALPP